MGRSIAAVLFAIAVLGTGAPARADEAWLTSCADAQKVAAKEKKPLLIYFTGSDWAPDAIKLKNEVFSKPEFLEWAKQNVVLLEIDFPQKTKLDPALQKQNTELKQRLRADAFPTVVFTDAELMELGRTGYVKGGPDRWVATAAPFLPKKAGDPKPADPKEGAPKDGAPKDGSKDGAPKDGKPAPAEEAWGTSYDAALKSATSDKKLILADFTGSDWCINCIKLRTAVFDKPEFKEWAKKNVVLLELDFPTNKPQTEDLKKQNDDLRKKHNIQSYPTIVFLDATGKAVGNLAGYAGEGATEWLKKAQAIVDGAKKGSK